MPGLSVSGVGAELASAKFDLSLTLTATAQGLRGGLNYSTDLFERGTIERMLGHLARVLEQVAADPDVRALASWSCWTRRSARRCWRSGTATEAEYPADRCIHELFEAQAARTPDAVAVVSEEETLTLRASWTRARTGSRTTSRARRGAGRAGGDLPGARAGDGRGDPGRAQGGRRLRPAGPRLSGGAAGVRCSPTPASRGAADAGGAASGSSRSAACRSSAWTPTRRRSRRSRRRRTRGRGARARPPGVRHLHLRLDGPAQGGDGASTGAWRTAGAATRGPFGSAPDDAMLGSWRRHASTCSVCETLLAAAPRGRGVLAGRERAPATRSAAGGCIAERVARARWFPPCCRCCWRIRRRTSCRGLRHGRGAARRCRGRCCTRMRERLPHGGARTTSTVRPRGPRRSRALPARGGRRGRGTRSAARWGTCACTCWTRAGGPRRWASRASCTSGAWGWRAATWAGRG